MSLANKYRPKTLKTFKGSETTIKALQSKIDLDDHHHVYLFTGIGGTGKTTLARILAKHFGAEKMDYKELDSADFRGIETIRSVRKQIPMRPINGNAKAYTFDECHKLTPDAQEALLKTLEDCPDHVYIFLCTTNPEKLKATLKRRCLHFEISPLNEDEMVSLLKRVSKKEDKDIPKKVLVKVTEDSIGSPGMALSILERIIDLPKKEMIKEADKVAAEKNAAIDLCRSIFQRAKWNKIASIITGLKNNKEDPERVRRTVLGYCSTILLKSPNEAAYTVMDAFRNPFFDTPWESLVLAAFECWYSED